MDVRGLGELGDVVSGKLQHAAGNVRRVRRANGNGLDGQPIRSEGLLNLETGPQIVHHIVEGSGKPIGVVIDDLNRRRRVRVEPGIVVQDKGIAGPAKVDRVDGDGIERRVVGNVHPQRGVGVEVCRRAVKRQRTDRSRPTGIDGALVVQRRTGQEHDRPVAGDGAGVGDHAAGEGQRLPGRDGQGAGVGETAADRGSVLDVEGCARGVVHAAGDANDIPLSKLRNSEYAAGIVAEAAVELEVETLVEGRIVVTAGNDDRAVVGEGLLRAEQAVGGTGHGQGSAGLVHEIRGCEGHG